MFHYYAETCTHTRSLCLFMLLVTKCSCSVWSLQITLF